MSKRVLKKHLKELTKEQLTDQILDLYHRFKEVKTFYDFSFNPQEDKLIADARFKISKEYFPVGRRRPKARRSVAQKLIKHFLQLELEAGLLADLMLYNVELMQSFSAIRNPSQESFYKSAFNSFKEAVEFIQRMGLENDFRERVAKIEQESDRQHWFNAEAFYRVGDEL